MRENEGEWERRREWGGGSAREMCRYWLKAIKFVTYQWWTISLQLHFIIGLVPLTDSLTFSSFSLFFSFSNLLLFIFLFLIFTPFFFYLCTLYTSPNIRYAENQQLLEESEDAKSSLRATINILKAELRKKGINFPISEPGVGKI